MTAPDERDACRQPAPAPPARARRRAGDHDDHHAPHAAGDADADARPLVLALILIGAFMVGEVLAAAIGGSLALFADAGHMCGDVAALGLSAWAARMAARPATAVWTYGLRRVEILSAALNGVLLAVVGVVIAVEAVRRLVSPAPVAGRLMLAVALVGVVVNLLATWALTRADRSTLNVRGAVAHVMTDLYAFAGTAVAAVVIVTTGWRRADAVASLLVVALMLAAAWPLLRDSGAVLLQGAPEHVDLGQVRSHLAALDHVLDVHDLHAWTVASGMPTLSAHVVVADHCFDSGHAPQVLDALQACLSTHFGLEHATVQLEPAAHAAHEHSAHP